MSQMPHVTRSKTRASRDSLQCPDQILCTDVHLLLLVKDVGHLQGEKLVKRLLLNSMSLLLANPRGARLDSFSGNTICSLHPKAAFFLDKQARIKVMRLKNRSVEMVILVSNVRDIISEVPALRILKQQTCKHFTL